MTLMILLLISWVKAYSGTQVFEGLARLEREVVYSERHTQVLKNGKLISDSTEFNDTSGNKIGSQVSRYANNPQLPEHIFRDEREKHLWGLVRHREKIEIFSQDEKGKLNRGSLIATDTSNLVAGPGLMYFVGANMETILSKGKEDVKLIIPGKLKAYDFEILPLKSTPSEVSFEIRLKSWPLRYFSPRLKLTYDRLSKRLLSFEGISGLRDKNGDMMMVNITYDYSIQ